MCNGNCGAHDRAAIYYIDFYTYPVEGHDCLVSTAELVRCRLQAIRASRGGPSCQPPAPLSATDHRVPPVAHVSTNGILN